MQHELVHLAPNHRSTSNILVQATMTGPKENQKYHCSHRVCWGDVEIYEFPNVLGDNPAVSEGAPLTIGWKHTKKETIDIEYYEYLRIQLKPRKRRKDLLLSGPARDTL